MNARGYTLIELAIALLVITLLTSSVLVPLGTQAELRQTADAEKTLEAIREALLGHAAAYGYLPCPDAMSGAGANDGIEDATAAGNCRSDDGNLPWVTLGTAAVDPWHNRYRYHVDPSYAARAPAASFTLASGAGLRVWTTAGHTTALTSSDPNGAVAVVVAHGRNGRGATNAHTGTVNPAPTGADELDNTDGNLHFVSRAPSAAGTPAGEFDDVVGWLSRFTLYNRMLLAGRLP